MAWEGRQGNEGRWIGEGVGEGAGEEGRGGECINNGTQGHQLEFNVGQRAGSPQLCMYSITPVRSDASIPFVILQRLNHN